MFKSITPLKLFNHIKFKNNSILSKLIISFTLPGVAVILIVSLFFSFVYSAKSMKDVNSISFLTLSNVSTSFSNLLDLSMQTTYELYRTQNIKLIFSDTYTPEDMVNSINYLHTVIASNSQLYSIYLFSNNRIRLISGGSYLFEESSEQLSALVKSSSNLRPTPRQLINNNGENLNLITTIYTESEDHGSGPYIIVNYKANDFFNQNNSGFLHPGQDIIIADKYGKVLAHTVKDMFSHSILSENYFKETMKASSDYGSINTFIQDKRSIVNYFFLNNKAYVILFTSDEGSFFGEILKIRNTIIIFCLIILFLLAVVSVFISYRIYNPISNVFSNIRSLVGNDIHNNTNISSEVKYFSTAIKKVVEKLNNLEQDSTINFNNLKSDFFRQLLTLPYGLTPQEFEEGLIKYKINKGLNYRYQLFILRVDNYKQFSDTNSKESILFHLNSAESILCETLNPYFECSTFSFEMEHVIVMAGYSDNGDEVEASTLLELFKKFQDAILQLFNLKFTIGISEPIPFLSVDELRLKYNQTYNLTNYRLIYGKGLIFRAENLNLIEDKNDKTAPIVESIVTSLKTRSTEQYGANIDLLFDTIKNYSHERILYILFHLAESIVQITADLQQNNPSYVSENIEHMLLKIKGFEDFSEIKEWFTHLFVQTSEVICGLKNKKSSDLIAEAIKFINEYYSNNTLSASLLADKMGITPQYFSKIFKQFTGLSFPDYINNIRLEKAKDLLMSNPLVSITVVCEKVGYNSASYFATSFTKKFGVPPSKFS